MKSFTHTFTDFSAFNQFIDHKGLSDNSKTLIQCFDGAGDRFLSQKLLTHLSILFPQATVIGASTDGEIINGRSQQNSIVLSFSVFEDTKIYSEIFKLNEGSYSIGEKLGEKAQQLDAKAIILFSDALNTNGDFLMSGISAKNSNVIVSGGMAGDNGNFTETYVIFDHHIHNNCAVAVFLKGENLHVQNESSFNWIPIGPTFTVTHSSENKVYTLDDTPIQQIYRQYLGDEVADILPAVGVAFPIIMHKDAQQIGRAPISLCDNGGLGFGGNIPQGTKVQFGIGNISLILEASLDTAKALLPGKPEAIYLYSCMARRRYLGSAVDDEMMPLNDIAPVSGFFTYGEFYTNSKTKSCLLHNETMTILTLSEHTNKDLETSIDERPKNNNDWSQISFRALSHLINKTSIELQTLNKSLQKKIKEEIQNNREKDKMMLAQSKRATMGEMVSMIAHQWRQPITTIGLIADNLYLDVAFEKSTSDQIMESSTLISKQVQYLSKTIEDFGNYFNPENKLYHFSINILYKELSEIMSKSFEHYSITLVDEFEQNIKIYSYKREIVQICLNIFNNAKDAILEKRMSNGHIKFMHRYIGGEHQISISDNAGGVAEENKEKIFEPYFSTKAAKHGAGLGLYMAQTIAQRYLKGNLTHHNDSDGAVFILTFKDYKED